MNLFIRIILFVFNINLILCFYYFRYIVKSFITYIFFKYFFQVPRFFSFSFSFLFVKNNFLFVILLFIFVFYCIKKIYSTEKGRFKIDNMILWSPVIGPLVRKVAVSKFTRTLSTLLQSGVPILDSLQVVGRTSGNKVIERAVFRVAESIAEGRPIAEPLEESGVFPNMVVQMISVGESVGALDTMLEKIADFYDEEVDQAVENLTAMIEPFMMVFLGGMIGGIVVAMYLPIFQMAGKI